MFVTVLTYRANVLDKLEQARFTWLMQSTNNHQEGTMTTNEQTAYEMGRDAALAAATWTLDGNTSQEHIARMIAMLNDGDPEVYDYLPRVPNLSGEYADDPTPLSLARDITGFDTAHIDPEEIDAIADAYEAGVNDHFESSCEEELRKAAA